MAFSWDNLKRKILGQVSASMQYALEDTARDIASEIKAEHIIPRMTGRMEDLTIDVIDYSRAKKGEVRIVSPGPYARRLYYHPEYNFHRTPWAGGEGNANAQAYWFEPWESGAYKNRIPEVFAYHLDRYMRNNKK